MARVVTFLILLLLYLTKNNAASIDEFKQAINAARVATKIYNEQLDPSIPWKELNESLQVLNYQQNQYYSAQAKEYVRRMESSVNAGLHKYFVGSLYTYEWAVFSVDLLQRYLDEKDTNGIEEFVFEVLAEGIDKMNSSLNKFNAAKIYMRNAHCAYTLGLINNSTRQLYNDYEL